MKRIGLIVNPYAGIGGRVGLKGSDGAEIRKKALEMGAVPMSASRTVDALKQLSGLEFVLYTYPGRMGEEEAREAGIEPVVIGELENDTTAEDTKRAAAEMLEKDLDLLVLPVGMEQQEISILLLVTSCLFLGFLLGSRFTQGSLQLIQGALESFCIASFLVSVWISGLRRSWISMRKPSGRILCRLGSMGT